MLHFENRRHFEIFRAINELDDVKKHKTYVSRLNTLIN